MGPVPEEFAEVYRRRGMTVPTATSALDPGALVAYWHRAWHQAYAKARGYFWLPCVLCDQPFGGHEIGGSIPDPIAGPHRGIGICPACTARRNGGSV